MIDVGYAGVIGAHRIANGQSPYGNFPVQDDRPACGARRRRGRDPQPHPDERPLRVVERARRHVRARLVPRVRPRVRALRLERQVGRRHAAGRALHVDRVGSPRRRRARPRRPPLRRDAARGDARVRLGRLSVHAVHVELEHERRDPARVPDLGLLARDLAVGARRGRRARRAGRSSRRSSSRRSGSRTHSLPRARPLAFVGRVRARHGGRVLGAAARAGPRRGRAHLRRPDVPVAARPRVAVLALGLGAVPRRGDPRPEARPARPPGAARRGGDRGRVRAAAEVAAPARRADRRAARRLRARARRTGRTSTSPGSSPSRRSRSLAGAPRREPPPAPPEEREEPRALVAAG